MTEAMSAKEFIKFYENLPGEPASGTILIYNIEEVQPENYFKSVVEMMGWKMNKFGLLTWRKSVENNKLVEIGE